MAMIQVNQTGCLIAVQKIYRPTAKCHVYFANQTVYGVLKLKDTGLVDFECIVSLRKTINLRPLSESLAYVADDDYVWFHHLTNTPKKLYFGFGSAPKNRHIELTLLDENLGLQKHMTVSYAYQTVIASRDLGTIAERMLNLAPEQRPDSVSVDKEAKANLEAGMYKAETTTVEHCFSFAWRYWGLLMKALRSAEKCDISVVTVPDERVTSVMLGFNLGEVGALVLLEGHILLFKD